MKKFRTGIIGCGGIANGKHMRVLAKMNDVEMVAFCDIIRFYNKCWGETNRYSK